MSATIFGGPKFEIQSERAIVALGNSERKEVGRLAAETLDQTNLFPKGIDLITLNKLDENSHNKKLQDLLKVCTVIGHSAAAYYVQASKQIIAFNPPERTRVYSQLTRAMAVGKELELIEAEDGAYVTGVLDQAQAILQMASSPITLSRTMRRVKNGSSVELLAEGADRFPAGRAIVHAGKDAFGFQDHADLAYASNNGVSTAFVPESYHLSFLREPRALFTAVMPHILPSVDLAPISPEA